MIPISKIQNTETCFVQLWLMLEQTRVELRQLYKRYCIRHILESWFADRATDDLIWEVCTKSEQLGLNELPMPQVEPRPHREFLRALTAAVLNLSMNSVNLAALDHAYSIAYPDSTPININKKGSAAK